MKRSDETLMVNLRSKYQLFIESSPNMHLMTVNNEQALLCKKKDSFDK